MKAIYAGSFDPITLGHLDIIARAAPMFELVIGVAHNAKKKSFIPIGTRRELVVKSLATISLLQPHIAAPAKLSHPIEVHGVYGLLADFCKKNNIHAIVRGLRNTVDFEYEFGMAHVNAGLGNVETIFLPAKGSQTHVSSSVVRELAALGADISEYVPAVVAKYLNNSK